MDASSRKNDPKGRGARSLETFWVEIFDDEVGRRVRIAALVSSLGAVAVSGRDKAGSARPPHVALVALPTDPSGVESSLLCIRDCRASGVEVLAYAPGVESWPVAQKCRSLIAGAVQLIDAAPDRLERLLREALGGILHTLAARAAEDTHVRERLRSLGVEGASPAMLKVSRQLLRYAALSDLPVLVTGETGTGKERITRALHQCDPKRATGPFVAVNCGALVSSLAESELFGHRRGSFTGAERARPGLVRAADRGILFLDEIGELELALQTKLLRVLQEGAVLGVGEEQEVAVDVRVVAATHRDLPALVAAGRFRADLLHRLCVLPIHLPPLRERLEDLPVLVDHFLTRHRSVHRLVLRGVSREFTEALALLHLPGNIRQLENILRQALVNKKDDSPLALADMPLEVLGELAAGVLPAGSGSAPPGAAGSGPGLSAMLVQLAEAHDWNLNRCLRTCEREVIAAALARLRGNQTRAASLLGVTTRCVYNKLRKHGLVAE